MCLLHGIETEWDDNIIIIIRFYQENQLYQLTVIKFIRMIATLVRKEIRGTEQTASQNKGPDLNTEQWLSLRNPTHILFEFEKKAICICECINSCIIRCIFAHTRCFLPLQVFLKVGR